VTVVQTRLGSSAVLRLRRSVKWTLRWCVVCGAAVSEVNVAMVCRVRCGSGWSERCDGMSCAVRQWVKWTLRWCVVCGAAVGEVNVAMVCRLRCGSGWSERCDGVSCAVRQWVKWTLRWYVVCGAAVGEVDIVMVCRVRCKPSVTFIFWQIVSNDNTIRLAGGEHDHLYWTSVSVCHPLVFVTSF